MSWPHERGTFFFVSQGSGWYISSTSTSFVQIPAQNRGKESPKMRADLKSPRLRTFVLWTVFCIPSSLVFAQQARLVVNAPAVNMYAGPSREQEVVSQALYGRTVEQLESQGDWLRIRTLEDAYEGWVLKANLLLSDPKNGYASSGPLVEIRVLRANLYREPSVTKHEPVIVLPFETRLQALQFPSEEESRWIEVQLPDGKKAWIQRGDVAVLESPLPLAKPVQSLDIPRTIEFSKNFLGLPYTWGGRSSFGYDCSGFTQMLMHERGFSIPRDASVQAKWEGFRSVDVDALQPGDLLYFGSKGKITHTGMFIGNGQFIHATTHDHPVIQISPLNDYWRRLLLAQRRVKE